MNNDLITWHDWNQKTFDRAKDEDRAVFLYIGYIGCYWCKEMEESSFSDEKIATSLKENFVAVKVDSHERPDMGLYFRRVFKQMTGRVANYPLCIFMTPEKIPFYSATYIPAKSQDGLMGFDETLELVSQKYSNDKSNLIAKGNDILKAMSSSETTIKATKIDNSLIHTASSQIKEQYDKEYHGFGGKPKFPRHSVLNLSLEIYKQNEDDELLDIVCSTLDTMLDSALHDSEDSGFYDYCIDREWQTPSSGKRLYTNALMVEFLMRAYRVTRKNRYKNSAIRTIEFLDKNISNDGTYCSLYNNGEIEDKMIVCSWNAMLVIAMFEIANDDKSYINIAEKSLEKLLSSLMINSELYHSSTIGSKAKTKAFLEDYAYLAKALLRAYDVTIKERYLIEASKIINESIRLFFESGRWKYSNGEFKSYANVEDGNYPSSVSVMTDVLQKASKLINPEYQKFSTRTIEVNSYDLMRQPISMPELCRVEIAK